MMVKEVSVVLTKLNLSAGKTTNIAKDNKMPTLRVRSSNNQNDSKKRKLSTGQLDSPAKKVKVEVKKELDSPAKKVKVEVKKEQDSPAKKVKVKVKEELDSPAKKVKVEVKDEDDLSDIENESQSDIIKRREENIRMNQEFIAQLGILEAKQNLIASQKKNKPTQRGLKREKVPVELLPRRSSLRIQNKAPDGAELPGSAKSSLYTPYEPVQHLRPPSGDLAMSEYLYGTSDAECHKAIQHTVTSLKPSIIKESKTSLEKYISNMAKTRLTSERVAKVVPERSFSVTVHPSATKVIAAAGDKWGKIGILDVCSDNKSTSEGVCCYTPHSRPVTCLEFPTHSPEKLYSCGYDGSLRCADLQKEIFTEIYSEPEDDDVLLRNFSWLTPHTMLVAQNTGCVALVDIRTDGYKAEKTFTLHNRSLRTVSVHPVDTHYFCTAGVEGVVRVWDLRNTKVKNNKHICEMNLSRGINSAYFSPVTGKYILTTSMDDKLTVFDSSVIGPNIKTKKSISHNNHTGRWLTPFRATWHPAREDVFVVGSMNRPREISLFGVDGKKLHSFKDEDCLGSVCSLNALHPTRDLVVGTNSSGRIHVFM